MKRKQHKSLKVQLTKCHFGDLVGKDGKNETWLLRE